MEKALLENDIKHLNQRLDLVERRMQYWKDQKASLTDRISKKTIRINNL